MKVHTPLMAAALLLAAIAGFAAEPAPAPSASAPSTAAPIPASTATTPTAVPSASPSPSPSASTAPAPVSASDSSAIAKAAHSLGYKSHQQEGKTVYCKKESKVGTNFQTTTCLTEDQVMATVKRSEGNRDSIEALQRAFLASAPDKFATDAGGLPGSKQ
jgi:hypothetical protein